MTTATAPLRGPLRKKESHLWVRHAEDYYVEPEWCSARLFEAELFEGGVWDPACGSGRILRSARAAGLGAFGSDVADRGCNAHINSFLDIWLPFEPNIASNPPFGIAEQFVAHALTLAERKVAMLLPANWVQGDKRSRWLEMTPLCRVWFITPRPSMPPGPVIEAGGTPGNGTTDYAWFVWERGHVQAPTLSWLRRDPPKPPLL